MNFNAHNWPFRRVTLVMVICIAGSWLIAPTGEWAVRGYVGLIAVLGSVMPVLVRGDDRGRSSASSRAATLPAAGSSTVPGASRVSK